jgi:hypothetical protein
MNRHDVDGLDPARTYWVPAVVSPRREWAGAPGCRRGARFVVDSETLRASRDAFSPFDSKASCLRWIMRHRDSLNRSLPGASIRAVPLDRWLLGLD